MNNKFVRELVPFVTAGLIVVAGFSLKKESVTGETTSEIVMPKYAQGELSFEHIVENKKIILNIGSHPVTSFNAGEPLLTYVTDYDCINSDDIQKVIYYDNNMTMLIDMKDSDVYYYGKYDKEQKQFIYEKIGDDMTIIPTKTKK